MKKEFTRTLCLLLSLCLFSGCTKDNPVGTTGNNGFGSIPESSAEADLSAAPVSTGTFTLPFSASYGWDPYACISMENRAVMQLVYEGLFTMNQTFDPEPVLCSEYTVSENGMEYTLTLRDACFSDGRAMTADDVVYSYQKAAASDIYGARFRDVSSMAASGTNTVIVYMENPNDRLPCMLDFPIIPNFSTTISPLGTGPFVRQDTTCLVKNTHWWGGANTISFNTVGLYSSGSAEDTRDNFEIDTIQLVYNDPNSSTSATYHCDYELWNSKSTVMEYLGFNMSRGIFQENTIRSAVLKAIDRSEIAESVYHNYADAAILPVSPASSMYYEDLARKYSYNRDTALEELMTAEFFYLPDGHPVLTGAIFEEEGETATSEDSAPEEALLDDELLDDELLDDEDADDKPAASSKDPSEEKEEKGYNAVTMVVMEGSLYRQEAAEMVAENLRNVGFTVTVKYLEYSSFIYTIQDPEADWDLYYVDAFLTPDFDLRTILYPGNKLNYDTVPSDDTLRSLYYKALENSGNRYELYEYLMEKAYICPILFQNEAVFTTRGVFTGFNPSPNNLFYGISNIIINN